MYINFMPIAYNFTPLQGREIKYIVIHDTANTARGADAIAHYKYFNSGDKQSSADIIVDSIRAVQLNPDIRNNYMWHVGDGFGKNGITNGNSIGVEICVNSDGNYDTAVKNAVEVVKQLMQTYKINVDHVVTHHDASGKICPASMSANNFQKFTLFKQSLYPSVNTAPRISYGVVTASVLNVRNAPRISGQIIGKLTRGETVKLDILLGDWWSIYYGNHGGFVHKDYIQITK